jgi:hypothetical protein
MYMLPFRFGNAIAQAVIGGWQHSGILTLQSGFPLTATVGGDIPNAGTRTTRPHVTGEANLDPDSRTIDRWFNTDAFSQPAAFTFGSAGRNIIDGPGSKSFTAAFMKNFVVREGHRLQFRAEFQNFPNHPNFGLPNASFGSPAFGTIRSGGAGRETQLGLKYIF